MIQIDETIISLDVLKVKFSCDVQKCKGACCVHGDSGAPLELEEATALEDLLPQITPYLSESGLKAIQQHGPHMIDNEGDLVTVLVDKKECAFVFFENGIAKCSIEKAYFDGKIPFRKPVSCHLYPVRVKKYNDFTGVNYDQWEICKDALVKGRRENIPLFVFLEDPLKRKFGEDWYRDLKTVNSDLVKKEG